jgi:hypothetical protein
MVLSMAIEDSNEEGSEEECEEAEVACREELMCAIKSPKKEKKKNKSLQTKIKKKEEFHNSKDV